LQGPPRRVVDTAPERQAPADIVAEAELDNVVEAVPVRPQSAYRNARRNLHHLEHLHRTCRRKPSSVSLELP
jgi:hypothetical protein